MTMRGFGFDKRELVAALANLKRDLEFMPVEVLTRLIEGLQIDLGMSEAEAIRFLASFEVKTGELLSRAREAE